MAFPLHRVLLILLFVQHSFALHKSLLVESNEVDDIRIIADFVKNYITKIDSNRRIVSLKFTANSTGQAHKQFDLMHALLANSAELNVTYTFLDLKICPNELSNLRSLNVLFVDGPHIFW